MKLLPSLYIFLAAWLYSAATAAAVAGSVATNAVHKESNAVSDEFFSTLDELARIVDITYCVGTTGIHKPFKCLGRCEEFTGFELVNTWHTGPLLSDSCGFLAVSHAPWQKRIILGFRGTYSLANAVVDLAANPQPYTPYNSTNNENGDECANCTVHTGFLTSWHNARKEILSPLAATRAEYPDYSLVLIGHSLGGAVAALAGLEFSLRGWEPHVTTFGEPRVGNAALAAYINERFDLTADDSSGRVGMGPGGPRREGASYHRVTHVNDPVPLLPFEEWGYAPHAGEVYISKVDVPPDVTDVSICRGNEDPACLTGTDAQEEVQSVLSFHKDITANSGNEVDSDGVSSLNSANAYDGYQMQSQVTLYRNNLSRRLQLWELFFAHRDYFWRLGVCLPHFDGGGKDDEGHRDGKGSSWRRWWEHMKKKFRPWSQ